MKTYSWILITIISSTLFMPVNVNAYKYGLGSCLDQDFDQPIWSSIKEENVDGFIFLGDNVYGDHPSGSLSKMKTAYEIQKNKLPSWLMDNEKEILAIWDDHDYGLNDGGKDYKLKKEAQKMFLNFWNISPSDPRSIREGTYFKKTKNINGTEVEIIGLDTRYFRSKLLRKGNAYKPNMQPDATILGQKQWKWFESSMNQTTASIIVILSSIQILATEHPYEKWANFPLERKRLLNLISLVSHDKTVVAVSGDRHRAGIYRNNHFVEITASSLNKPGSKDSETDKLLIDKIFPEINYGILDIEPEKNKITVSIHNRDGLVLNSHIIELPLEKTEA